jgi:hypothetical protein
VLQNSVATTFTPKEGEQQILVPETDNHSIMAKPDYSFTKTASWDGGYLYPGAIITYTLTGMVNSSDLPLGVHITDNIAKAADGAVLDVNSIQTTVNGETSDLTQFDPGTSLLEWNGKLADKGGELSGKGQVVITYRLKVARWGVTLQNSARLKATVSDSDFLLEQRNARVTLTVPIPDYDFTKTATHIPEGHVDGVGEMVLPGDKIEYTLTGSNPGGYPLDVEIADDLSGVLENARITSGPVVTGGQEGVLHFDDDSDVLTWNGVVPAEGSVVVTYTVTIRAKAWDVTLANKATSSARLPRFEAIVADNQSTKHVTPAEPAYTVTKLVDPVSGSTVAPGDVVMYTVIASNTGGTPLDVNVTDDLNRTLEHAVLLGVPDGAAVSNGVLTWGGTLQPGETATLTYSVRVTNDAFGATLRNTVSSEAATPVGGKLVADPAETVIYTEAAKAIPVTEAAKVVPVGKPAPTASGSATDSGIRPATLARTGFGAGLAAPLAFAFTVGGAVLVATSRKRRRL